MVTIRRWYVYLVCAVSLQAAAWAVIALGSNFVTSVGQPVSATAFQIAVIVVGLPLFLGHWLWAQRLAAAEAEPQERASAVRRLYVYGMLAAFLAPGLANLWLVLRVLFGLLLRAYRPDYMLDAGYAASESAARALVALAVLGLLGWYQWRVVRADAHAAPEAENAATVRRLFILLFSAIGLAVSALAGIHLLRWFMLLAGASTFIEMNRAAVADELARAVLGVPVWLLFWSWAQRLFASPSAEERETALRKFYLYAAVFVAVLSTVANATIILAGLIRAGLGLAPNGDVRLPLPIVLGMLVLWAYHWQVLRADAAQAGEAPRQAGVRRLYGYLVAAVGLAALLVGLGGEVSVLIRALLERLFGPDLKEALAWFTAALLAGLPVWLLPWRRAQADAGGPERREEQRSLVRKLYLYFYLLAATLTVLSSAVFLIFRLLSRALGDLRAGNLASELAQAAAYLLIAAAVWLYHGAVLRDDTRAARAEKSDRLAGLKVAVVDAGEARLGQAILAALAAELPLVPVTAVGFPAPTAGGGAPGAAALREATLLVGSWEALRSVDSAAHKILIPAWPAGGDWAGVERASDEALARHAVRAVKQYSQGEEVRLARPLGAGAIVGIIVAALIGLGLLMSGVDYVVSNLF
jgi:hypothetical protein